MNSSLRKVFDYFPKLGPHLKKGECGKIAVIGGAPEYTGAPYFAALTPLKIGADLSYVFCHPDAALVIKSYSPELIVHPNQEFEQIDAHLNRIDSLVIGPGLGRDQKLVPLLKKILHRVKSMETIGDGIFLLADCLEEVRGCQNVILTPNHREFDRLYQKVFPTDNGSGERTPEHVKQLAANLQVSYLLYEMGLVEIGGAEGCNRRCGGQGDLLAGAIALFTYWARLKTGDSKLNSAHIVHGAHAASDFIRFCAKHTFNKLGRSMNASDILAHICFVVQENEYVPSTNTL